MSTGTTIKRIKRRFKRKLYHALLALNDFNFGKLRPLCYLLLITGMLLAWSKLPAGESCNITSGQTVTTMASSVRTAMESQSGQPVDVVALFLTEGEANNKLSSLQEETLYSFFLTGKELSYLAEGAITTVSQEHSLYLDGLNFTYHKNRLPFNRVTSLSTCSGTEIEAGQLYRIVSTDDIFALFHYISYRSIGIMKIYPKDANGALLSDYQKVLLNDDGTPFTLQIALDFAASSDTVATVTARSGSIVTMQSGFNLIDLIREPNRITICMCALFIAFFSLLWYIVPRINRIRIWFRIYRIRRKKRSTGSLLYGLKKRF